MCEGSLSVTAPNDKRGFWLGLAACVGHSQAAKLGGLEPRLERGGA